MPGALSVRFIDTNAIAGVVMQDKQWDVVVQVGEFK